MAGRFQINARIMEKPIYIDVIKRNCTTFLCNESSYDHTYGSDPITLRYIGRAITLIILLSEAEWRIYASTKYTIIGSDNGSSPGRRQAII